MDNSFGETGLNRFGLLTRMATFVALAGVVGALIVLPVVGGIGIATRNSAQAFTGLPSDLTQVPLPQQNTLLDADGNVLAVPSCEGDYGVFRIPTSCKGIWRLIFNDGDFWHWQSGRNRDFVNQIEQLRRSVMVDDLGASHG